MRSLSYVEIDRLVFEGFALSAEQAERVRALVAGELQRLLGQDHAPGALRQMRKRSSALLARHPAHGERTLAASIAQQVAPVVQRQIQQGG